MWPYPTPGHVNLNELKFTLPGDAAEVYKCKPFWQNIFWENGFLNSIPSPLLRTESTPGDYFLSKLESILPEDDVLL